MFENNRYAPLLAVSLLALALTITACGDTVSSDPTETEIEISTAEELQRIGTDADYPLDGRYVLTGDIDASETATWNDGAGFDPIGDEDDPFSGEFDGNGFTIEGLTIDRQSAWEVGLFGAVAAEGTVQNVTLEDARVVGARRVGGLAGQNAGEIRNSAANVDVVGGRDRIGGLVGSNAGEIISSEASGSVEGPNVVGGLAGHNAPGAGHIQDSAADVDVVGGEDRIGGLVGVNGHDIVRSEATGTVDGRGEVGGLVGTNSGTIEDSAASGDVVGSGDQVGGLVGHNFLDGAIQGSKAIGNVAGGDGAFIGGLVGENGSEVSSSYATGAVTGGSQVGGLIGGHTDGGEVTESYAAGNVTGEESVGGLVGLRDAGVSASYWDREAAGQAEGIGEGDSEGATGLTTDEMQGDAAAGNMTGFDFEDTWETVVGDYPALLWEGA